MWSVLKSGGRVVEVRLPMSHSTPSVEPNPFVLRPRSEAEPGLAALDAVQAMLTLSAETTRRRADRTVGRVSTVPMRAAPVHDRPLGPAFPRVA